MLTLSFESSAKGNSLKSKSREHFWNIDHGTARPSSRGCASKPNDMTVSTSRDQDAYLGADEVLYPEMVTYMKVRDSKPLVPLSVH